MEVLNRHLHSHALTSTQTEEMLRAVSDAMSDATQIHKRNAALFAGPRSTPFTDATCRLLRDRQLPVKERQILLLALLLDCSHRNAPAARVIYNVLRRHGLSADDAPMGFIRQQLLGDLRKDTHANEFLNELLARILRRAQNQKTIDLALAAIGNVLTAHRSKDTFDYDASSASHYTTSGAA